MTTEHDELDCAHARELASARADGELNDAEPLERHLADCTACCEFAEALKPLHDELRELAVTPTNDAWPRIATRTRCKLVEQRLVRLAAAVIGFVGTFAALRSTAQTPANSAISAANGLQPIAALQQPDAELQRLAQAPEHQLLLAFAAREEARR